ncbi:MAG: phosphotransferase family protein [Nocardioides sp.]
MSTPARDTAADAKALREEDAFDVAAVHAWLQQHASDEFRDVVATQTLPEVRQFPGGASNLTYLLRYPDRDLILRRPPVGAKAKSAHDMGREYRIQSALKPVYPQVPAMVGFCEDDSVIGSDFYVMERVEGAISRKDLPWDLTPSQVGDLCRNFWDGLIELHSIDVTSVPALAALGKGDGYVTRQVSGWTDRMTRATTDDMGDWSDITSWLHEHQPADVAQVLIHNDYRLDNVVLATDSAGELVDNGRIVGVLDWEMATVGDPLMDLGGSASYWIQADDDPFMQGFRRQPSNAEGMWTRQQIVDYYCERMGYDLSPEQWRFYEVFGHFRLAVIAQQIWYRYFHKQTTNPAYAIFGPAVAVLEAHCRRLTGEQGSSA